MARRQLVAGRGGFPPTSFMRSLMPTAEPMAPTTRRFWQGIIAKQSLLALVAPFFGAHFKRPLNAGREQLVWSACALQFLLPQVNPSIYDLSKQDRAAPCFLCLIRPCQFREPMTRPGVPLGGVSRRHRRSPHKAGHILMALKNFVTEWAAIEKPRHHNRSRDRTWLAHANQRLCVAPKQCLLFIKQRGQNLNRNVVVCSLCPGARTANDLYPRDLSLTTAPSHLAGRPRAHK